MKCCTHKSSLLGLAALLVFAGAIGLTALGCKEKAVVVEEDTVSFVNVRCPMMDAEIDAANVTVELIRDFKGQKVALCCAECLVTWDKLSDDEKATKLAAAK